MLESGCVTRKNAINVLMKNVVDMVFGGLSYWMFGYGMSYGTSKGTNPVFAVGNYFVDTSEVNMGYLYTTYIFQLSFASTATTIVSGAVAERFNFSAYCIYSFLNTFIYCLPAGWIWGDHGFLNHLGVVDIAGCCPVHLVGGTSALVATIMVGPREGRYDDSKKRDMINSPINAMLGMFILWWGWLGFNCGSTFGVTGAKWKYASRSAITTLTASIGGGLTSLVFRKKFLIPNLINGILSALVAVTAGCVLYNPWEAFLIGSISSLLTNFSMPALDILQIDDPVGAIPVHFVGSIWGMIAVGLFLEEDSLLSLSKGEAGIFQKADFHLLGVQSLSLIVVGAWSVLTTYTLLQIINLLIPLRIKKEDEEAGADEVEHNIKHYTSLEIRQFSSTTSLNIRS
ncbi:putative ammonium transporter 3 [Trichonephila inaurata madagascariensis]|uniref:Putative ammonium transporter 3 n=1 Tax=Trichonephila inaurata madagascariensis TaxID=2747483 RepID=A0A8X7BMW9_9ARAC|nr:putative ammonium transporter 3 [Trichonephila inaurata madagascariensis]